MFTDFTFRACSFLKGIKINKSQQKRKRLNYPEGLNTACTIPSFANLLGAMPAGSSGADKDQGCWFFRICSSNFLLNFYLLDGCL